MILWPSWVFFNTDTVTNQMYEELRKEVDWEHKHPEGGAVFMQRHLVTLACVADIWESEERLNNFINSRSPAMKKINMPILDGEIFQIDGVSAFPAIDKYREMASIRST